MAVLATRITTIVFTGDVTGTETIPAASNALSPGSVEIKTLASGFNTITAPTGGSVPTACTIVPPVGNTVSIIIKGVTGDTGLRLHNTDPTTIAVDPTTLTIGLTAVSQIIGVRLYWT